MKFFVEIWIIFFSNFFGGKVLIVMVIVDGVENMIWFIIDVFYNVDFIIVWLIVIGIIG